MLSRASWENIYIAISNPGIFTKAFLKTLWRMENSLVLSYQLVLCSADQIGKCLITI